MSHRLIDVDVSTLAHPTHIKEESVIDPETLGFAESRMALQVLRTDEDQKPGQFITFVRRPWTEELVAAGTDYDKRKHFMPHETEPWLDALVQSVGTRTSGEPMVYGRLRVHGTGEKGRQAAANWFRGVVGDPLVKRPAHWVLRPGVEDPIPRHLLFGFRRGPRGRAGPGGQRHPIPG